MLWRLRRYRSCWRIECKYDQWRVTKGAMLQATLREYQAGNCTMSALGQKRTSIGVTGHRHRFLKRPGASSVYQFVKRRHRGVVPQSPFSALVQASKMPCLSLGGRRDGRPSFKASKRAVTNSARVRL
jgi:hypothetical protein